MLKTSNFVLILLLSIFFLIITIFFWNISIKSYYKYKWLEESSIQINWKNMPLKLTTYLDIWNNDSKFNFDTLILKNFYIESFRWNKRLFLEAFVIELWNQLQNYLIIQNVKTQWLAQISIKHFIKMLNNLSEPQIQDLKWKFWNEWKIFDTLLKIKKYNKTLIKNAIETKDIKEIDLKKISYKQHYGLVSDFINTFYWAKVWMYIYLNSDYRSLKAFHRSVWDYFDLNIEEYNLWNVYQNWIARHYIWWLQYLIKKLSSEEQKINGYREDIDIDLVFKILKDNKLTKKDIKKDLNFKNFLNLYSSKTLKLLAKIYKKKFWKKPELILTGKQCEKLDTYLCFRWKLLKDLVVTWK